MRLIDRILAVILTVTCTAGVTGAMGSVAYAEEEKTAEIMFKYTGDDADDSVWKAQKGNVELTTLEGKAGKVLKVDKSESYAAINKATPITEGNVVISYDYMAETEEAYAYVMFAKNEAQSTTPIPWTSSGRFGALLYNGKYIGVPDDRANSLTVNSFEAHTEPEVWKHVDLWLNFDTKKISFYQDGNLISTEKMNDACVQFYSFGIVSNKDLNTLWLDNVYMGYVPTGEVHNFKFIQGAPPEATTMCYADVNYEPIGHIYTNSKIKLTAELENAKDESNEIKYEYRAVSESGRIAYTEEKTLTLNQREKKTIDIEFTAEEYGFYDSVFTIKNPESGMSSDRVSRFSYIKTRSDGAKSRIMGSNSHYQVNRGTAEVDRLQKLYADMGMREMREGVPWNQYEPTVDEYGLNDMHKAYLKAFQDNGQNNMLILGHDNIARGISFPKTDAELAAWATYVEKLVQDVIPYGIKDFEVWNEVDLTWGAGKCTAEEYVKLLKVTYPIVHKYIPDARVFAFSCARNYTNFIGECLSYEGCSDNFDGISYHPYDAISCPEEPSFNPAENGYLEYIAEIEKIVETYGLQDKVLVISEFGYTSASTYITEEDQANRVVRASCVAYDHVEYINWFMNLEKINERDTSEAEYRFGWMRAWQKEEILYEAKPVMASVAQYTSMVTENAESLGNQEILDGKGRLYRYRDDGRDIYMAWTVRDEEDFAIDLGASSATIYDRFGNSHTQKTENGILYIRLSERPQYITGNFTKCEEVAAGGFKIEGNALEAARGDILGIKVYKSVGDDTDYSVNVDLPNGAEVADNKGFVNGMCNVGIRLGGDYVSGSTVKVTVLNKDGDVVWFREMPMNLIKSVDTDFAIKYIKSGRWQAELKIKNNSSRDISGSLNILYPEEISVKIPSVKIDTIIPKMTRLVTFNLPIDATRDYIEFKGEIVLDNGEVTEIEESSYFTGLTPISKEPKIDGVIEAGEYNMSLPVILDKERMVQGIAGVRDTFQWKGKNDLSGKGYINYDDKYFYLAMEVEDDALGSNDPQKRIWANDSIQFSFAERRVKDSGYTEIGIGLVDNEPAIARYSYMGEKENIAFHEAIGSKEGFEEDTELMIKREGTKTTYELKCAWVDIFPTREAFNMDNVFFSIIINENDGDGRVGWLEFSPGIGYVKNPADFTSIVVLK